MNDFPLTQPLDSEDGISIVDSARGVVQWNQTAYRLTGLPPDEVLGGFCFDYYQTKREKIGCVQCHPGCPMLRSIQDGLLTPNFDLKFRNKTGNQVWLNVSAIVIPHEIDQGHMSIFIFRDVSCLKQIEELASRIVQLARQSVQRPDGFDSVENIGPPDFLSDPLNMQTLTHREREVLTWMITGASTVTIAQNLNISPVTVRNHIQHILEKMGAHNRLEVVSNILERK